MDTSIGSYEQLYNNNPTSENVDKYYDGYLELKGKFSKWTRYWCELKKKNLHFFKDVNTQIKDNYAGFFPIEGTTKIELQKKLEWHMVKGSRKIILKAQNQQLREDWINAIRQAMSGGSPIKQGYILPGSGPVSPPNSPQRRPSLQPSPPNSPAPTSTSRSLSDRRVSTDSLRYALQPEQMQHFASHAESIAESVSMSVDEMKIQQRLLEGDQSWYQATFRREDVEAILRSEENGVFIVRDYIDVTTSKNMGYVISLKDQKGGIRHHKILKSKDGGRIFIKGYEEKFFDSLTNLLRFFIASQKKTIALMPFNENTPSKESVAPPFPGQHNGVSIRPARSHSLYQPESRGLPPVPLPQPPQPPAPSAGMVRAPESMRGRDLPRPPGDSRSNTSDDYLQMTGPAFRTRQLPTPPPVVDEDSYLVPSDQNTRGRNHTKAGDEMEPYEQMSSPQKQRYNPPSNFRMDTPSSPPMSPDDPDCYINMIPPRPPPSPSSPSAYENYEPTIEQAPTLPPKRRSQSVRGCQETYVNHPAGGPRRPDRPPLRKAHTIGR
ncbi:uncharacterized protein LOC114522669 isoform X2 [Dendronephthya gigantea]|uniref:uncharacterized protein LOC114522669 isoform X2 n=1 Tax=Dendronephthya gigantea TaxID=151771 RepID=UPI00106CAFB4|nr:uncharacterized protein LOC114522669 isoform X2 [Dendronephthya gigantea]